MMGSSAMAGTATGAETPFDIPGLLGHLHDGAQLDT